MSNRLVNSLLLAFYVLANSAQLVAQSVTVKSVENRGLLFTDNQAGVDGTDAGYSLPIGSKTLWMFGDVFLTSPTTPHKDFLGSLSNCGLIVSRGSGTSPLKSYLFLSDPKTKLARPLLPNDPTDGANVRYWPFGSWYDSAHNLAYLFYGRILTTGSGALAFRSVGNGLAVADTSRPDNIEFKKIPSNSDNIWWKSDPDATIYGSAVVTGNTDGYIYVVGQREGRGGKRARLARVKPTGIADKSAYQYLGARATWSSRELDAVDIEGIENFPSELSISYNRYVGGYLASFSVGISDNIRLYVSDNPWGPYRKIAEISAPHRILGKGFCYAGKEHPELNQESGKIVYITYVDSERYWLRMLKVTFQK